MFYCSKSSKSKNEILHEEKFKDLPSNTRQVDVERRVLDLESETSESTLTGVTFRFYVVNFV